MTNPSQPDSEITVYSTAWCGDCRMAKAVLDRHGATYRWIDIDRHPDAVAAVLRLNGGYRTVPTIVFPDGECWSNHRDGSSRKPWRSPRRLRNRRQAS